MRLRELNKIHLPVKKGPKRAVSFALSLHFYQDSFPSRLEMFRLPYLYNTRAEVATPIFVEEIFKIFFAGAVG